MFIGYIEYLSNDNPDTLKNYIKFVFETITGEIQNLEQNKDVYSNYIKSTSKLKNFTTYEIKKKYSINSINYKHLYIYPQDILSFEFENTNESSTGTLVLRFSEDHLRLHPGAFLEIKDINTKKIVFNGFINSINITKSISNQSVILHTTLNLSSWEHIYLRNIVSYIWQLEIYNLSGTLPLKILGVFDNQPPFTVGKLAAGCFLLFLLFSFQLIYPSFNLEKIKIDVDNFAQNDEQLWYSPSNIPTLTFSPIIDFYNSYIKTPNIETFFYPDFRIYIGKTTWFKDTKNEYFKEVTLPNSVFVNETLLTKDIANNVGTTYMLPNNLVFDNMASFFIALGKIPVTYNSIYNALRAGFNFRELQTYAIEPLTDNNENINTNTEKNISNDIVKKIDNYWKHITFNQTKLLDCFNTTITVRTDYFILSELKIGDFITFRLDNNKETEFTGRLDSYTISYKVSNTLETDVKLNLINCINNNELNKLRKLDEEI